MTFALSIWVLTVLYKYKLSTPSPRRAIIVNISNKEEGQEGKEWRVGVGGGELKAEKPSVGGVWVISGTIQLQLKYHLLGSSNQS